MYLLCMVGADNVVSVWAAKQMGHILGGPMVGMTMIKVCFTKNIMPGPLLSRPPL